MALIRQKKKKGTDLDEEEENSGEVTPTEKFRQHAGINSPKKEKTMNWGNTEEENKSSDALASVITQVSPDNNKAPKTGVESLVTQVSRDDANLMTPMNTTQEEEDTNAEKPKDTGKGGGICGCLSTLFNCCSSDTTEDRTVTQINNQNPNPNPNQNQNQEQYPAKGPELNKEVNSKTDLLPKNNANDVDDEISNTRESSVAGYDSALLPPLSPENKKKRCLVLDLDETLVHSSFKPVNSADFIIPVEIDGVVHRVYVLKRPFVDEFLLECSKSYELVIFTASLAKYADPLLDQLDTHRVIAHRLFRESCTLHGSAYVKDLRKLGRSLKRTIFVDNSPHSYAFQPKNAVPITSWFDDKSDTELRDFLPVLNTTLLKIKDVRNVLDAYNRTFDWLCRQSNVDISVFEPPQQ